MSPSADNPSHEVSARPRKPRRWWLFIPAVIIGLLLLAAIIVWSQRTIIADGYIQDYLDGLALNAEYEIVDLGTKTQHLRNIRIGDAARPDVTIDDLVVITTPQFSGIAIDEVRLSGVRLYGAYADERLSFGVLNQFIYTDSDEPLVLPDLNITLDDVRARIDSPYGAVGVSANGAGHLLDGFDGTLALIADNLAIKGCTLMRPSAFLSVSVDALSPKIAGPLRLDNLSCADSTSRAAAGALLGAKNGGAIQTDIVINRALDAAQFSAVGDFNQLFYALDKGQSLGSNNATLEIEGAVDAREWDGTAELAFAAVKTPWADAGNATLNIAATQPLKFATLGDMAALSIDYQLRADNIALGRDIGAMLAGSGDTLAETPIGPLWQKILPVLKRSARSSRIAATGQVNDGALIADNVTIREGNNRLLARIDDARYALTGGDSAGLKGFDFSLRHRQLPGLKGKWRNLGAHQRIDLEMPQFSAGQSNLSLSPTSLYISGTGLKRLDIDGGVNFSGPLPGGKIRNARIPLSGTVLDMARYVTKNGRCQSVAFDTMVLANFALDKQAISLCPENGAPLLAFGAQGLAVNARTGALDIAADLGGSPLYFASSGVDINYPAASNLNDVQIRLGAGASETIISSATLSIETDADTGEFGGQFTGAEAFIDNVPLLLSDGTGQWGFGASVLSLISDNWTVSDRAPSPRFAPLQGRNISLILDNGMIAANGDLYAPAADRFVASVAIGHDLARSAGSADLNVPGIRFTENFQPSDLTSLTVGIIALADGTVSGTGRIDWNADGVTSTGKFGTDGIDFAAAFGPVQGLKGDIIFSDLLAFATPPGQMVTIDEVNPGIAAYDGVVRYQLLPDQRVVLEDAHWPFSGGDLSLEPTTFNLAIEEERELIFEMTGLNAEIFLQQFDFENLTATGTFDGRLPMRFNRAGGRIEGGRLSVGPDGGSLSYLGELTYQDLGFVSNFAFQSLRGINYRTLEVEMNGPLDGELVTRVQFTGLSQGEIASRNFLTKQIAKLPIQFNINIRAPFFQLITSTRSLYDSNYLLDPVAAGLFDSKTDDNAAQDTQNDKAE